MRRIIAFFMVALMLCTLATTAIASVAEAGAVDIQENIAYMSLENADEETKAAILEARSKIINSTSWVADGAYGYISDENGNIVEVIPQFSEIFPGDWSLPDCEVCANASGEVLMPLTWQQSFYGTVQMTRTLTEFDTVYTGNFNNLVVETISTIGYCSEGGTYNVEYFNVTTNRRWGIALDLEEGEAFNISAPENATVSVRTNSDDSRYYWTMMVHTDRVSVQ